jgi:drug/metabolite transporter (DMT)-like permease
MTRPSTYFHLAMAAIFWGGTFVAGRNLASLLDPEATALLRFVLASVLLLGWMYGKLGHFPIPSPRQAIALLLLGLSGVLAYNLFFFHGLQSVEAGRASLIIAANPVGIALASHLLLRERLGLVEALGIVLSVLGAMTVIGRGDIPGLLTGGVGSGEWLLLGCVCSWTAYTLIGRHVLHGMPPLTAVTYSSACGTLMLAAVVLAQGGLDGGIPVHAPVWLNIVYLSVFGTVLAFVWFYKGVQAIGAARAGQFINLVPISGICFGAWLLDEPLTWSLLVGGLLVLAGLWLANRQQRDDESAAVP